MNKIMKKELFMTSLIIGILFLGYQFSGLIPSSKKINFQGYKQKLKRISNRLEKLNTKKIFWDTNFLGKSHIEVFHESGIEFWSIGDLENKMRSDLGSRVWNSKRALKVLFENGFHHIFIEEPLHSEESFVVVKKFLDMGGKIIVNNKSVFELLPEGAQPFAPLKSDQKIIVLNQLKKDFK